MNNKLLFLVLGVALGVGGAVTVVKLMSPTPPPAPVVEKKPASQANQDLATATTKVQQLEEVNAELSAALARSKKTAASVAAVAAAKAKAEAKAEARQMEPAGGGLAALFGGGDTNRTGAMRKMIQAGIKQQAEAKLSALKLRLHLTEDQEAKVREVLDRQFGFAGEMASKMFEGKLSKEELAKANQKPPDLDAELKNILTPDQQTEYQAYKAEERQTQAQMMANIELAQLQPVLQLDQAQQDKVYAALYAQAEKQFSQAGNGLTPPTDAGKVIEQQFEDKKTALRSILTPQQFEAYEKHLNSQRDLIKAFMPGDAKGGGAVSVTTTVAPAP
jgi:hypothetical protein